MTSAPGVRSTLSCNCATANRIVQQQQQVQLAEYLSGQIDEIEYRNRMASLVKFQAMEVGVGGGQRKEFGLEFFDPMQNMSEVRDISIENLFNWSNSRGAGQIQQYQHQQQSVVNACNDDTLNDGKYDLYWLPKFYNAHFKCGFM